MTIDKQCRECKVKYIIVIREEDYLNWQHHMLIQDAFPYLTADQRELLMSGICGKCFNKLFKE